MYTKHNYIRPHLEYCVSIWDPFIARNIDKLEQIQQRVTKLVPELARVKQLRLQHYLNLYSLYCRRQRGDLIEFHQTHFYLCQQHHYRGHDIYIAGSPRPRLKFFTNRIVTQWGSPPSVCDHIR